MEPPDDAPRRGNPALGLAAFVAGAAHRKRAANANGVEDASTSHDSLAATEPAAADGVHANHPFFHYYGLLVHQQNMLQDVVRTSAYHDAITRNPSDFAGATVMDVGTGSGILAFFAAKAGAARVYAVEASDVADRAAALMAANGLADRVVVLKQKVELVELPAGERVDVIVSEPMGFMLFHEQMLIVRRGWRRARRARRIGGRVPRACACCHRDAARRRARCAPARAGAGVVAPDPSPTRPRRPSQSYMIARKRFLKPGGRMFPSTGTLYVAPFSDAGACRRGGERRRVAASVSHFSPYSRSRHHDPTALRLAALWAEQASKVAFWSNADFFGLDLRPLADAAAADHFAQPVVGCVAAL